MKTSKLVVAALLSGLFLTSSVYATEGGKSISSNAEASNSVRAQIANALSDISAPTEQSVFIHFTVTPKGFVLTNVEGADKLLAEEVKNELHKEYIQVPSELNGKYVLKVRFADKAEITEVENPTETLRSNLANALSEVVSSTPASVKVLLFVDKNGLKVKNVEGDDKSLAFEVKNKLDKSNIVAPADLAGNYQVTLKF